MVFVTSDLHFCHDRDFIWGPRGFENVTEHNLAILRNWNSVVTPDDDVYILGDLMLNDDERGMRLLSSLVGNKHIVLGNHDSDKRIALYKTLPNTEILGFAHRMRYNGLTLYLSHYPTLTANCDSDKPLKARVINLCGHTHTNDKFLDFDKGVVYHVELDAHNMFPVQLDNVINDIINKEKK